MNPTFDIAAFRASFPEFTNSTDYPDAQLTFWSGLASQQVRACVWKDSWVYGVSLYVAHEITVSKQDLKAAKTGGTPGTFGGVANNKTVGAVTVSYDSQSTSEKDAGYWNLTNYGKQFYRLCQIFGAQAIQL